MWNLYKIWLYSLGSYSDDKTKPFDKKKATNGNGTQVSFVTDSRHMVDNFHKTGLKAGGKSEGSGGESPPNSGVYYSYIRDLDGNKICAFTNNKT